MTILIPTADYPPIEGGISTVTLNLSRSLAAMGHDVTVVAPYFADREALDQAEPATVAHYGGYRLGYLRIVTMARAAWPLLRSADLVLAMNISHGGLLGWFGRRMFQTPYVAFCYAYEFLKFRNNLLVAPLLRRLYGRAQVVVAISRFTRDRLIAFGVDSAHIETIHPGAWPAAPYTPEEIAVVKRRFALDRGPVILAVGRFIPRKGQLTLVRAMPYILEQAPDAQLVLVGRGPCISQIANEANTLGVREQVLMPGRVSDTDLAGLYEACTVFALPTGSDGESHVEGFGLVFAEAHAHGKPVVAGRSGGVEDAVADGESGLLVEPDQPELLADKILTILRDTDLARRLGDAGRRRVEEQLNWNTFARRVIEAVEART